MSAPSPSRRTVLATVAWGVPVVSLAAAAPAFASSQGAVVELSYTRAAANDGEVTIANTGNASAEVSVTFNPTPDEDAPGTLQSHNGFDGFTQVSTEPFTLRGTVDANSQVTGWCWWRPAAGGTGTTTIQATAPGITIDSLTVALG